MKITPRIIFIVESANKYGVEAISKQENLPTETIHRYFRAVARAEKPTQPKILVFDIETAPIKAYVWGFWDQNISQQQLIQDWFILTWSAKWLLEPKIISDRLTTQEAINQDDGRLIKGMWKLLNEADIVIAHNGDKFDIKKLNTRFLLHGIKPPHSYHSIDTLKVAKKYFAFSSNRLDFINHTLGLECKIKTEFKLWSDCMAGKRKALKQMETYNRQDVAILEEMYIRVRPYIKGHPNLGLYIDIDEPICSNCGSDNINLSGKYYYTPVSKFRTFRCECGAVGRMRKNLIDKTKRETLLISPAK